MAQANGFDFDRYTSLGSILLRRGALTKRQLQRAVDGKGDGLLGETVVAMGFCTQDEISAALKEQEGHRRPAVSESVTSALQEWRAATVTLSAGVEEMKERRMRRTQPIVVPISPEDS